MEQSPISFVIHMGERNEKKNARVMMICSAIRLASTR